MKCFENFAGVPAVQQQIINLLWFRSYRPAIFTSIHPHILWKHLTTDDCKSPFDPFKTWKLRWFREESQIDFRLFSCSAPSARICLVSRRVMTSTESKEDLQISWIPRVSFLCISLDLMKITRYIYTSHLSAILRYQPSSSQFHPPDSQQSYFGFDSQADKVYNTCLVLNPEGGIAWSSGGVMRISRGSSHPLRQEIWPYYKGLFNHPDPSIIP